MVDKSKLSLVIVEAVKSIIASTDNEVVYEVQPHTITKGIKQKSIAKVTVVKITITENL